MDVVKAAIWAAGGLVAIAVGLASPASADSRGDAAHSTHTSAGPRASKPAIVQGAVRRASVSIPKAAQAVASPRRATPAVSRPTRTTASAAPQMTPSDIWSSLMTRIAGIFGWDPRGKLQTIYQGTHFVIPGAPAIWITSDSGDATFTADSVYDLKDADQHDWNKLAGLTFTPLEPNRNAAMVVWRLNNVTDPFFEIGPFFNDNYAYVFPTEAQIIRVPAEATFSYYVDYTGITVSYGDISVYKPYPADLIPNFWTSARVFGWFGGSEVAPKTVSYYKHIY